MVPETAAPTTEVRRRFTGLPLWGVVVAAGLVIVCAGLRSLADIVAPIFLILTLVITFQPLRTVFVRRRFPRWLASLLVLILIFLMMGVILGAVTLSVTRLIEVAQDPKYFQAYANVYNGALDLLERAGVSNKDLRNMLSQINVGSVTSAAQTVLRGLLSGITSGFSLGGLMALTAIFLAFDGASAGARMQAIRRLRPETAAAFDDFALRVRRYWIVTTVFGLIVAVIDVIALLIIGVPLVFTWGVLAFVTNYIPNVGFVIGLIPPTLIAFLDGGPGAAIAVLISFVVINFVIQTLIQPRFTGDAAGINATVAFLSLIFWAAILGPLGALLAVPATLFVKTILVDHSTSGRWFGELINADDGDKRRPPAAGPRIPRRVSARRPPTVQEAPHAPAAPAGES
jgi:predicted PurR-regulated permease PerM